MTRTPYNRELEHTPTGRMFPAAHGGNYPELPEFHRPISIRENYRMTLMGETPYWIPACGWFYCDVNMFRPRQHPDNLANHQCFDGGPAIDFSAIGNVVNGWFDCPMEWEPKSNGAMPRPGRPTLEDISEWPDKLVFPNLDDMNWDEIAEMNKDFLASDKVNQLGIQFGLWERMMNLMDVENAAVALLDEDQEEGIHTFLDAMADLYIDYIGRMARIGRIDAVYFHDDWGTQNAPFFSLETARKFFVPAMKRIVDFCHEQGILFEHHSCGNAGDLVPAMEECGSDFWIPQDTCNDIDELLARYEGYHIKFGVYSPFMAAGSSEEEIRELGRQFVEKYAGKNIMYCMNKNMALTPGHDPSLFPIWEDAVYEYSRLAFQDAD